MNGALWTIKRLVVLLFVCLFVFVMCPLNAMAADRLVVKNDSSSTTFSVADDGTALTAKYYNAQGQSPGFWLDETGSGGGSGAFFVVDNKTMQVQRRTGGFGAWQASIMLLELSAPSAAFTIRSSGNVGFGKWADTYPLEMSGGAYCTGGAWVDGSTRDLKDNIESLEADEAFEVLKALDPVKYNYKNDSEELQLGFIAEDVPDLVATKGRKGMCPMDVVSVLTKVLQEQQKTIEKMSAKIDRLEGNMNLSKDGRTVQLTQ